jgi:hypothetical protein
VAGRREFPGGLVATSAVAQPRVPDDSAPLVRRAFELMAPGDCTTSEALRLVTRLGLTSRQGRALTAQAFGTLVRNRIHAGFINAPGLGVSNSRGDFEPLILQVLFDRVGAVLRGGREAPGTY